MTEFTKVLMQAQAQDGTASSSNDGTWGAVIEAMVMVFCITIIPSMLGMDPRTMQWYDFWKPILSAMLAAAYVYIRARKINLEENIRSE